MISQDRLVRVDYERRKMAHHDAVSLIRDSRFEGKQEGRQEGRQEALVGTLIMLLQARGFSLSSGLRARVEAETDSARLQGWIVQAALAPSVEAVFSDS